MCTTVEYALNPSPSLHAFLISLKIYILFYINIYCKNCFDEVMG